MGSRSESASKNVARDGEAAALSVDNSTELARDRPDRLRREESSSIRSNIISTNKIQDGTDMNETKKDPQPAALSRFLSIHLQGSIEVGSFSSVNDVYLKYSVVTGPDWILSSGSDVGITQISRYKKDENGARIFVWNQPISISYRSYNYFGWPQIVLSIYYFDTFGNDQILGYGCTHLPISNRETPGSNILVNIYAPQSSSMIRQVLSWILGRKPELVDSNLFARGDCRSVLQMVHVGQVELSFNLTSKDVAINGYRN